MVYIHVIILIMEGQSKERERGTEEGWRERGREGKREGERRDRENHLPP